MVKQAGELGPRVECAAGGVAEHAGAAGGGRRVVRQREALLAGRDAGVAEQGCSPVERLRRR